VSPLSDAAAGGRHLVVIRVQHPLAVVSGQLELLALACAPEGPEVKRIASTSAARPGDAADTP
jgi:hypothetical protein